MGQGEGTDAYGKTFVMNLTHWEVKQAGRHLVRHMPHYSGGACRGVRCEAVFSPTFRTTPFSPNFGSILCATPVFEINFKKVSLVYEFMKT